MFGTLSRAVESLRGSLGASLAWRRGWAAALLLLALAAALPPNARAQAPQGNVAGCLSGLLPAQGLRAGGGTNPGQQPDLLLNTTCKISQAGTYYYGNVNIVAGGRLEFDEPSGTGSQINFWAKNIVIENGGTLAAGTATAPYGSRGGVLNIYIYGKNQSTGDPAKNPGQGVLCQSTTKGAGPCGVPGSVWADNGQTLQTMPGAGKVSDYFYQYGPLYGDNECTDGSQWTPPSGGSTPVTTGGCKTIKGEVGYFGYKVLALSYGGTLQLFGYKGTALPKAKPPKRPLPGLGQGGGATNPFGQSASAQSGEAAAQESAASTAAPAPGPNPAAIDADLRNTGFSWMRLAANLATASAAKKGAPNALTLSMAPGDRWWSANDNNNNTPDEVVVTTTDYLPGHSEKLTISGLSGTTLSFLDAVNYPHNGTKFLFASRLGTNAQRFRDAGMDQDLIDNGAETRAAVALLTRSIRILSAGDTPGQTFEKAGKAPAGCQNGAVAPYCYYFGAHAVFRQGFKQLQIQGVEFVKMGQGGKLGHYPMHFHMARQVPTDTFIKDSSVNESMTRWIVLHATQGVLLQRNVGWKSIGHGYYLESGNETDNKLYSNLGIFARAAVNNPQNPRKIPGILAADANDATGAPLATDSFPYRTDYQHPSVFWITNGWNEFVGNMAAGAGACGAAYWLVPAWNSDMVDVPTNLNTQFGYHMKWTGFAQLQWRSANAASTPLKLFSGNFASSTMNSFQTVSTTAECHGPDYPSSPDARMTGHFPGIRSYAPAPQPPNLVDSDTYYPHVVGGGRVATMCPLNNGVRDCSLFTTQATLSVCAHGPQLPYCAVTVLDHYTSSFHWAETNLSSIWLRPQWALVDDSVLTDVQNGGLSFITSGGYDRSSAVDGDWALVRTSLFVGNTQADNGYNSNAGPFENGTANALPCDNAAPPQPTNAPPQSFCSNVAEGVSFPLSNFGTNQRMFSIYDGPAYEESNIFLDITRRLCDGGAHPCVYANTLGVRQQTTGTTSSCYLANAAIGWKQPNGFFYPPSFHSSNLFFDNVDIRHYVIDALLEPGTYLEDEAQKTADYCKPVSNPTYPLYFTNFTDIDRQTELNDDDGTLTGLTNDVGTGTISVNPADFFNAPVQTAECDSNIGVSPTLACPKNNAPQPTPTPTTATTSPYDYVTAALFPQCGVGPGDANGRCGSVASGPDLGSGGFWSQSCTNPGCYGAPLYRQYLTGTGTSSADGTREVKRWFDNKCDTHPATPQCRWPFVRMGGQADYQRSTLLANHGVYYLDTSVSQNTQNTENFTTATPRSVNVFQGGQTYYMYFLYAKPQSRLTFQIYVGKGFDLASGLSAVRSTLDTMPMTAITPFSPWPAAWEKNYNDGVACANAAPNCYILQVTVDFSGQKDEFSLPTNGLCQPSTFCRITLAEPGNPATCGCALQPDDPLIVVNPGFAKHCQQACSVWSVKALDFPPNGVYGFSFTMPAAFVPDDNGQGHRPRPAIFPTTPSASKPDWLTKFVRTAVGPDNASGGACYYPQVPGTDCAVLP
jgi:hypothetical protein